MLLTRADASDFKLQREHAHPRDGDVTFTEDDHKYYIKGAVVGLSVTGLLEVVDKEKFDPVKSAKTIVDMKKPHPRYSRPDPLVEGARIRMSSEEIQELWILANKLGTDMHGKFERYLNSVPVEMYDGMANAKELAMFIRWWERKKKEGYIAFRTEWMIYDEDADLAGCIDFVMKHVKTGHLIIIDFKRCLTTDTSGFSSAFRGKCLGAPLDDVEATKLNKWRLQVNVYAAILERLYGVHIDGLAMIVCHENNDDVEEYWHERDPGAYTLLNHRLALLGKSALYGENTTVGEDTESYKRARVLE